MIAIIPVLIGGNSFSHLPRDILCMDIFSLVWTTYVKLFPRLYSSYILQGAEWRQIAITRYSSSSFCIVYVPCTSNAITTPYYFWRWHWWNIDFVLFSDNRYPYVGSYESQEFQIQSWTWGFTISKPYIVGEISYIRHYVPSNYPNDSIMYPVNVTLVCVENPAMMTFVLIPIRGNSFTCILSDSLFIVISGLTGTVTPDYSWQSIPWIQFPSC